MRGVVPPLLPHSSGPAPPMEIIRSSSSRPPPSSPTRRRLALSLLGGEGSSSNAVVAVAPATKQRWVGWEETTVLEEKKDGRDLVCYHLVRAADADDLFGGKDRDLAVVGTLWEPGSTAMSYRAHSSLLRLLEGAAGRAGASPRAAAAAAEATLLTSKSRKEIMEWLTSLVTDSPFKSSESADISDGSTLGNHDAGDATFDDSLALEVVPSTFAGNNSEEGFAWLSTPVPHLDIRRKHYRSFCLKGTRITVHDFIYIKNGKKGGENHVGYVEDMYEDVEANNMVRARWFDKVDDDHGAVLPPDVDDREIFLTYGLQDIRVEWVVGLAAVLNSQHFEEFQKMENHINWKPYLCCRQVENEILKPFDVTQLQGYSSQEIVRTLFNADANARDTNITEERGQKRKSNEISDQQTVENQYSRNVANDRTVGNHARHIATDENTMLMLPAPCNAPNNGSTGATLLPPRKAMLLRFAASEQAAAATSATTDKEIISKTVENYNPPRNAANDQTVKSNGPHNASATSGQTTSENRTPDNATNALTVVKDPSGASGSGLVASGFNDQELFKPGCYIEALSQDSSLRGCWFVCSIKKTSPKKDCIQVTYEDVLNAEGTGKLTEWIKLKRIAKSDPLGIRLAERPMVRPHVTQLDAVTSEVLVGTMVDARWNNGWWEGILLKHEIFDRVKVYLPGEKKFKVFHKSDLRRSFEWMGDVWRRLSARDDVAGRLNRLKEVGPSQGSRQGAKPARMPKKGILKQSKVGGKRDYAKPAGKKKVRLQSSKGDEQFSVPPGITIVESMRGSSQKGPHKADKKPAAKKEGHGILSVDGMSPEGNQPKGYLADFLKSDNLNWAARKARPRYRGSSNGLGQGGSSLQGHINPSACDGDVAAPVNSVRDKGKGACKK